MCCASGVLGLRPRSGPLRSSLAELRKIFANSYPQRNKERSPEVLACRVLGLLSSGLSEASGGLDPLTAEKKTTIVGPRFQIGQAGSLHARPNLASFLRKFLSIRFAGMACLGRGISSQFSAKQGFGISLTSCCAKSSVWGRVGIASKENVTVPGGGFTTPDTEYTQSTQRNERGERKNRTCRVEIDDHGPYAWAEIPFS